MTTGGRGFDRGVESTATRFTTCELAWSVAAGDTAAVPALVRELHPHIVTYCRGRARLVGSPFADADRLAVEVCRTILAELAAPSGADRPFVRTAYTIAADAADTRFRYPAGSPLTHVQQEILILRTLVGLDPRQTATALALAPARVGVEQHAALSSLRVA
ncbi:RNA polymerase subunit sigma-24 [Rhodococcus sp. Z13]|uniref:RNA polymerase subunit sigma-24 n=1 Tax=Rhodococcus sacchari TaxID=2962047 RepID=A0ACD4DFT1_9NOCA|nr:RNA polymerase subunit sigma-24 [Rhodococcus sp. Z13]UYP18945.1 RNA polymerase subunit sigma-24 [Rhodococcus sp. Z13]